MGVIKTDLAGSREERALFDQFQIASTLDLLVDRVALQHAAEEHVRRERARMKEHMDAAVADSTRLARLHEEGVV